ncbi:axotactin isoform X2 [Condylostylus longicornis]|uniref:axotactin isoform X2 n=1 Tax=Condylostylus longicornis TaxID=2530218 RepID=UPI00244DC32F|nr:axotactin isoform X2 [Condylostylus longicornis]
MKIHSSKLLTRQRHKKIISLFNLIVVLELFSFIKMVPAPTSSNSSNNPNSNIHLNSNINSNLNNQMIHGINSTLNNNINGSSIGNTGIIISGSGMSSNIKEIKIYDKCTGPGDPGPCKNFVYRWRYEQTTDSCIQFIWGGCEGNNNNRFSTEAECQLHCIGDQHTPSTNMVTTTKSPAEPTESGDDKIDIQTQIPPDQNRPQPSESNDPELTFEENGTEKTFMFAKNNTFIQLDGEIIQTFQLRLCREISFDFRTRLPHGLLVYHNVKNPDGIDLAPYALYVIVEKGQLKVVHVFGKHSTSVTVGEGLNRDEWHSVTVRIDVHGARLIARVDNSQEEVYLKGLNHDTNYGVSTNLPSVVLVGGLSSEEKLHGVKYIIESFVGCIRKITLKSGKAASDLLPIMPLIATKHENVNEGCINKCHSNSNLCFVGSRCINHYYDVSCDCFSTNYEGENCDIYTATILTLRGASYVSYRIYDWKDRVHSPSTRISIIFKTGFDDSALFYASGESIKQQYIAASLKNQSVYVEIDFGDNIMSATLGEELIRHDWHNLTIIHNQRTVRLTLDYQTKILEIPSSITSKLLFDPEIYFGGSPDPYKKGLISHNNFVGSMKYVYYNDISILYELKKGNPKVHYHGVLEAEFKESEVDVIPITYPFATSHIWWPINQPNQLNIKFDFRSSRTTAVLAYCDVKTSEGNGIWEIRLSSDKLSFDLMPNSTNNSTHSIVIKINRATSWHSIEFDYRNDTIKFTIDYRYTQILKYNLKFNIGDKVIIGSSLKSAASGLIGCIRDIEINDYLIEPRYVIKTERVVGEVALDNCNYIDPCKRPNTCEHGGKCFVKDDRVTCDCKDIGYIGKNCHFTKYRKTCEELALLGYTKSDVYLIDIDGNGIYPPAHVKCDFQSLENATKTIVEHNLPSQVDVRSFKDKDFSFYIKYREFSPEMLQELISHSLYCTQYVKYDCYKAPLELHAATWFTSSDNNMTVDFLGNVKRGGCPCSVNKTCTDPNQSCNCDVKENKWNSDEGYYVEPHSLGITNMFFLQQKDLDEEAQGRITLGPLECVETNTQKYVVTFTTSQSYIEVPGWRKGDIAFSFRTTGEKAILLFQPPIRPSYPSFMVALTGDYQLTFNFTLNTGTTKELVIDSNRKLNGGEWHKIWIDYNEYHVRFMINTDYKMVDLQAHEEFGPFEGSMYIGGATADLLKKLSVKAGLIGCFRGLVVNGEILDIYSYMSVHLSEIIKDCKPSCVPSPCKNGAECKELWSTFQCVCNNPWAHLGQFCETNINEKALTFINRESYLKRNYLNIPEDTLIPSSIVERDMLKDILTQNILINLRTYDTHSLVLYANDHLNNFIHLFITNSNEVVFMYNYENEIINLTISNNELNTGKSVQVAVIRDGIQTIMHVNDKNVTIDRGTKLLETYSNKPWINPEKEVLSPHRPPAPPTEYFQFNIGGYDSTNLLRTNLDYPELQGYIGCVRGLKIGENLIDLAKINEKNIAHVLDGVLPNCQVKCDAVPCKNGGICIENFAEQTSSCDCEHTSFMGEFCSDEKGADFSGESILQRKFELNGPVNNVKLQLAFSSNDLRRTERVMLVLQTINERSYYLMVGISTDNYLIFEEDRENGFVRAEVRRNFLNNARHSVYYIRNGTEASLLIDREKVELIDGPAPPLMQLMADYGVNEVQIGGTNTTDTRFAAYKSYSGCLSNIFIQVNKYSMKPLEEYMLFTKSAPDNITVVNSQGVRSAQCNSHFERSEHLMPEPTLNFTVASDKTWVEEPPVKIAYIAQYFDTSTKEEQTQVVFIVLTALFVVIVICCLIEVYRSHLEYKKRIERQTDEDIIWSKEQANQMHESPGVRPKPINFTPIINAGNEKKEPNSVQLVSILKNGSANQPPASHNQPPLQMKPSLTPKTSLNGSIPPEIIEEDSEEDDKEDDDVVENVKDEEKNQNENVKKEQLNEKRKNSKDEDSGDEINENVPLISDTNKEPNSVVAKSSLNAENKDEILPTTTDGASNEVINTIPITTQANQEQIKQHKPVERQHQKIQNDNVKKQNGGIPTSRKSSLNSNHDSTSDVDSGGGGGDHDYNEIESDEIRQTQHTNNEANENSADYLDIYKKENSSSTCTKFNEISTTTPSTKFRKYKNIRSFKRQLSNESFIQLQIEDDNEDDDDDDNNVKRKFKIPFISLDNSKIKIKPFLLRRHPKQNSSPIFIDEGHRQFLNPISYLGGPIMDIRNKSSLESVLSLD